jgi:hypothetical protein
MDSGLIMVSGMGMVVKPGPSARLSRPRTRRSPQPPPLRSHGACECHPALFTAVGNVIQVFAPALAVNRHARHRPNDHPVSATRARQ